VGIETLLNTVSIALQDNQRDNQEKTTLVLNKGKRDYLNIKDLGSSKDFWSTSKGKIF